MKSFALHLAVCSAVSLLSCNVFADEPASTATTYLVEAKIISADAKALAKNMITLTADRLTVATNGPWSAGGNVNKANVWLTRLEKTKGVDILSAPRIVTLADVEAKITIGQNVAYMEPVTNDLYRLTTLPDDRQPGVQLTITVHPGAPAASVRTDVKFVYNLLKEMTVLPGTEFKIGPPVMEHRAIETSVQSGLGDWIALGGMQSAWRVQDNRQEQLLVLLRVTRP